MKKIPPYGKELHQFLQKGDPLKESIFLWIGVYAWDRARYFAEISFTSILIPPWDDPFDYYFPVLKSTVLLIDTGWAAEDYIADLVFCLFECGASSIIYLSPDLNLTTFHKE